MATLCVRDVVAVVGVDRGSAAEHLANPASHGVVVEIDGSALAGQGDAREAVLVIPGVGGGAVRVGLAGGVAVVVVRVRGGRCGCELVGTVVSVRRRVEGSQAVAHRVKGVAHVASHHRLRQLVDVVIAEIGGHGHGSGVGPLKRRLAGAVPRRVVGVTGAPRQASTIVQHAEQAAWSYSGPAGMTPRYPLERTARVSFGEFLAIRQEVTA